MAQNLFVMRMANMWAPGCCGAGWGCLGRADAWVRWFDRGACAWLVRPPAQGAGRHQTPALAHACPLLAVPAPQVPVAHLEPQLHLQRADHVQGTTRGGCGAGCGCMGGAWRQRLRPEGTPQHSRASHPPHRRTPHTSPARPLQEDFGTQGRGGYFDTFGIIRDVIQVDGARCARCAALSRHSGSALSCRVHQEAATPARPLPTLRGACQPCDGPPHPPHPPPPCDAPPPPPPPPHTHTHTPMYHTYQNHLIQLLAFVAMEKPLSIHPDDLRDEKVGAGCAWSV